MEVDFLLVGGDRRQTELARLLKQNGSVAALGVPGIPDLAPKTAKRVVLPCPGFLPDGTLRGNVSRAQIARYLCPGVTVYTGQPGHWLDECPAKVVDLLADEITVKENARLTAEAALALGMQTSGCSFCGRRCLVIGYGRIGAYLSRMLQSFGAQVTVLARRAASRAAAAALGMESCVPGQERTDAEMVFNTVPAQVLSRQSLALLSPDCLWMELASAPGGLPPEADADFRFQYLAAPGLPGKLLPVSAARALYAGLLRHL